MDRDRRETSDLSVENRVRRSAETRAILRYHARRRQHATAPISVLTKFWTSMEQRVAPIQIF